MFLGAAAVGGLVFYGGVLLTREGYEGLGLFVKIVGGALGVGALVLTETAQGDAEAYGTPRCPKCDATVSVWPWSR